MFLAANLKYLRKFFGYSQKQVASFLEVDRSTYSYYEIGKTTPSPKNLIRLSGLYNTSIDDLLSKNLQNEIHPTETAGGDFMRPRSEDERELLMLFFRQPFSKGCGGAGAGPREKRGRKAAPQKR